MSPSSRGDDMMEDDDDYRWCYVCGCGGALAWECKPGHFDHLVTRLKETLKLTMGWAFPTAKYQKK